jgi:phage terminase large subunit-like protein
MSVLMVPEDGKNKWPTLGPLVCDFIEENLIFGPGDLRGQPAVLDDEKRALVWRIYEVYPKDHPLAGRRRFKRAGISVAKGLAKTEFAAWITACELHPEAPVRCDGFDKNGNPYGRPVTDPYIPMVAYTEEQSDELAYGALRVIIGEGPLRDDFDIGLERIMRKNGDGKAVSLSTSPNARDGARTTFQLFDETHRFDSSKLIRAHQTMMANLPKRKLADAWALEVTTAPEPGAGSVAENTMDYANAINEGKVKDARLFYFHRQSSDKHDLETEEGARAAVIEASGPAASWRDIDSIVELWRDPTTNKAYWERVWCNRLVKSSHKAFDTDLWKKLHKESPVKKGDLIVLGFDGAQFRDSTGIIATHVESGYQFTLGVWECPLGKEGNWQVPTDEVDAVVAAAFQDYEVWRMYSDPPYWQSWISKWAGEHGDDKVLEWWTNRRKQMSYALENFDTAIISGNLSHDGNIELSRHIGNSHRHDLPQRNEETGKPLWLIRKERHDSPQKIDLAMAAVLSWEARTDAIAAGATGKSVYETRGIRSG